MGVVWCDEPLLQRLPGALEAKSVICGGKPWGLDVPTLRVQGLFGASPLW